MTTKTPRGFGTGVGRRKRDVSKHSTYFDNKTWADAQRLGTDLFSKHSDVLRTALRLGMDALEAMSAVDATNTINDMVARLDSEPGDG